MGALAFLPSPRGEGSSRQRILCSGLVMDCRRIGHQGAVHHKARCAPGDQGRLSGSSSRLRLGPRHSSCHGSFVLLLGHRLHRGKNLWPFRSPSPYIRAHFCDGTGRGCCLIQKLHAYIYIYIYDEYVNYISYNMFYFKCQIIHCLSPRRT